MLNKSLCTINIKEKDPLKLQKQTFFPEDPASADPLEIQKTSPQNHFLALKFPNFNRRLPLMDIGILEIQQLFVLLLNMDK
jgi:hypothetical protein